MLRAAAARHVPPEILRAPKRGFSIPLAGWLGGELEPFQREVLSPATLESHAFFQRAEITRLIDLHSARRANLSRQLWSLLVFTLWVERFVVGSSAVVPGAQVSAA